MLCPEEHLDSWNICSMINQKYIDDFYEVLLTKQEEISDIVRTTEVVETGVPERNPH